MMTEVLQIAGMVSVRVRGWFDAQERALRYCERYGLKALFTQCGDIHGMYNVEVRTTGVTITQD